MNLVPQKWEWAPAKTPLLNFGANIVIVMKRGEMNIKHLLNNLFIIQLLIPLFYSFSQTLSNGQITFNFNGTVGW